MTEKNSNKPIVVYDGESLICVYWVLYWQRIGGSRLEIRKRSAEDHKDRTIADRNTDSSIRFYAPDGQQSSGVQAVFAILQVISPTSVWTSLYRRLPLFAALIHAGYRFLMQHPVAAHRYARFCWGEAPVPARYDVVSWLFLRILALVYIAAFASMAVQIEGLVGSGGILPIAAKLSAIRESISVRAYWLYPTIFWLNASNWVLLGACVSGVLSGLAVLFNRYSQSALILCYVLYLSIFYAGQDFTGFQWDILLLEAGFLAIFLCSGSFIVVLLYRWLLFRFMFLGGLVKIASGDPTWRDLTALTYHYETQPLPSPLAWYVHQLPLGVHQVSVIGVLLIELVVPFCIFMPRRLRVFAALSFIVLQCGIILTGNYNFFNIVTILLCLFLLDDTSVSRVFRRTKAQQIRSVAPKPGRAATVAAAVLASVVLISNATLAWSSINREPPPQPLYGLMEATLTLAIANTYGPFAVMTRRRGEIEIEASMNGRDWFPYEFRYKPRSLNKVPVWLIPHQPRLDWQMWFAALRPGYPPFWFDRLIKALEEAQPAVVSLFQSAPFPGQKPRYIRAKFYRYRYTDPGQREATGQIWEREYLGLYWPPEH